MIKVIIKNKYLIYSMVKKDLRGRYSGSFMGLYWSVINPLALLLTYTLVFSTFLKTTPGGDYKHLPFSVWLMAGLLPWVFFSDSISQGAFAIVGNKGLVTKTIFDIEILPICVVIANFITHLIALCILAILMAIFRIKPGIMLLTLPCCMIPIILYALAWCYLVAAFNVFIRDISQVIGIVLNLLFFLTPIFYPAEAIGGIWAYFLKINPYFFFVTWYREIILINKLPNYKEFLILLAIIIIFLFISKKIFDKLKIHFADTL